MRAAVLNAFGDADVLGIAEIPQPDAKSGEVLIRVHASSINPVDLGVRAGKILPTEPSLFPMILGWDAAGVIDALGPNTEGFNVGDRVMAISQQPGSKVGTHADFVALPADQVVKIADNVSFKTAAALPLIGTIALAALQTMDLPSEARVLINNPMGAVGGVATILAPLLGFALAGPTDVNVDGALDVRGNEHAHQAFAAVKDGGAYATIVPEWWKPGGVFTTARGITPVIVENPANREVLEPLAAWLA